MKVFIYKSRKKIVYWLAAGILFIIILGCFYSRAEAEKIPKYSEYNIVFFGDSLIGECREETSVTALMQERLNLSVFNAALGGTCMSYTENDRRIAYTKECLNMVGLAQAIYADDYRIQHNANIKEGATGYFDDTIDDLETMDFKNVDIVFIENGLNDYHAAVPIENPSDPYDVFTFSGALRQSVDYLRAVNPDMRIILVTPSFTWYSSEGITGEDYNPGAGTLSEYVDKEIEAAAEIGIEIIDIYHNLYTHENFEDWEKYTNDGLHPNETGRRMIADALCEYLEREQ
jgi:lysophospholipase L1-like esterase